MDCLWFNLLIFFFQRECIQNVFWCQEGTTTIQRIIIHWIVVYPVDSAIHLFETFKRPRPALYPQTTAFALLYRMFLSNEVAR